jgi:pyrimidine operon attenuation protein / uracil phosphoribosyltransferase
MSEKVLMTESDIDNELSLLCDKIDSNIDNFEKFALIGIQSRGVDIAMRIKEKLENKSGKKIKAGILDISFFRDDLTSRGTLPIIKETNIDFDITDMTLLLVDDVLFTGRTIKAALENLTSFGRPKSIQLCVLIDRGNRELPIQADYCAQKINTKITDQIKVNLKERDDKSNVIFIEN